MVPGFNWTSVLDPDVLGEKTPIYPPRAPQVFPPWGVLGAPMTDDDEWSDGDDSGQERHHHDDGPPCCDPTLLAEHGIVEEEGPRGEGGTPGTVHACVYVSVCV